MILLAGILSESPLAMVRARLDEIGAPYTLFHQRFFDRMDLDFEIGAGGVAGTLSIDGRRLPLASIRGVYSRLMDDHILPELEGEAAGSPRRRHCRALHDALVRWSEVAPGRVVNRTGPMGSNFSKPYQTQLIRRHGFHIPETLVTNDPELVLDFRARYGEIVYKSISGVRSIVQRFTDDDLPRLERIRWCPTQFQSFVPGENVRVHTVGGQVFATAAATAATDYRYAAREVGEPAALRPVELADEVAERCLGLAASLELDFAGIDLKVTPDGRVFCFEVNPSPAYSYYESHTGQPISLAVAKYLAEVSC